MARSLVKYRSFSPQNKFLKRLMILMLHLLLLSVSVYLRHSGIEADENPNWGLVIDDARSGIRLGCELGTLASTLCYIILQQGDELKNQGLIAYFKQLVSFVGVFISYFWRNFCWINGWMKSLSFSFFSGPWACKVNIPSIKSAPASVHTGEIQPTDYARRSNTHFCASWILVFADVLCRVRIFIVQMLICFLLLSLSRMFLSLIGIKQSCKVDGAFRNDDLQHDYRWYVHLWHHLLHHPIWLLAVFLLPLQRQVLVNFNYTGKALVIVLSNVSLLISGFPSVQSTLFSSYPSTWMALFQITLGDYSVSTKFLILWNYLNNIR